MCRHKKWHIMGDESFDVTTILGHIWAIRNFNHLACKWFKKTELKATYQGLVFPVGEVSSWQCPNYLKVVKPPLMVKPQSGRPKNKDRVRSQGEEPVPVKCGRCGNPGHTRKSCRETLPKKKAKVYAKASSQQPQEQVYSQQAQPQFYSLQAPLRDYSQRNEASAHEEQFVSQQAQRAVYSQQSMASSQEAHPYSQQFGREFSEAVNLGDP
ncbi:hypothetical protein CTI12_AA332450 [Artemisia annua]|uniref:CCHC-type domain-containing protein n=1 Tax=Artemisia annua TaxID=35608 RepID=A0A2U1MWM1_ARTAN|nr:hypothetical protein CTI12_AA332450 [Artemisia annua]